MDIRKTLAATPLAAAICVSSLFASHSAQAYVYAGSELNITDLSVVVVQDNGFAAVTGFGFDASTSAELNGASDGDSASCGGAVGAHDCGVAPVLAPDVANAPGSGIVRGATDYALSGNTTATYANANAAILTSELSSGLLDLTNASLVSEANLVADGTASASTTTESNTNISFLFNAVGTATITIEFEATLETLAAINNGIPLTLDANAQYSSQIMASVTGLSPGSAGSWVSNGLVGACDGADSGSCAETTDDFDLNVTESTSAGISVFFGTEFGDPSSIAHVGGGHYAFTFTVDCGGVGVECNGEINLFASNAVTVRNSIPEPGSLGLLGLGLLAMTRLSRARKLDNA